MNKNHILLAIAIITAVFLIAVCWHSVEEIHYLKSFFPREFTVSEAKDAAVIELIKIVFIAIPTSVVILFSLLLRKSK